MPHGTYPAHGQFPRAKAVFDRLFGDRIVQGAAALLALSDGEARDLPRPARVIPNGVEPCGTAPPAPPRPRPRLLFVGTDRPQKRASLLPRMLHALPDVDLHLAGRFAPGFRDSFGAASDRVTACGVLSGDALAAEYASADVVAHPAVGEAFGLVPFEAALAGTAAVVAGGHGCGEWFARAGGCVVPPDDADALNGALTQMRKLVPQDGTSLENAFAVVTTLSPVPDNVILITDGLPTQGASPPLIRKTVDGEQRLKFFERALGRPIRDQVITERVTQQVAGNPDHRRATADGAREDILTRTQEFPGTMVPSA
jgi:hypothetical protein